jgi:hypothetical protein
MCPRDLNPETRAFPPIPRLSTQVGEKSPSWGFHAISISGASRPASTRFRWPVGRNGSGCVELIAVPRRTGAPESLKPADGSVRARKVTVLMW